MIFQQARHHIGGLRFLSFIGLMLLAAAGYAEAPSGTNGPLRVNPSNPRYFCDAEGKAVFLAGHQIFVDCQDHPFSVAKTMPAPGVAIFDWDWYLKFAHGRNLNYLRSWMRWDTAEPPDSGIATTPMPYARTGPGTTKAGLPKFDLDKWNEEFWSRLRQRIRTAGSHGIYVSVMLFETYSFVSHGWPTNMFHRDNNNNNGVHAGDEHGKGTTFFTLKDAAIVERQKAFIRKAVDTLNDLDNVIWELANEPPSGKEPLQWMIEMTRYLREYEKTKTQQHPILVSGGGIVPTHWRPEKKDFGWRSMPLREMLATHPDCYSPINACGRYAPNVHPADALCAFLPGIVDRDHSDPEGPSNSSATIPWMIFTMGYGGYCLYDKPFEAVQLDSEVWDNARFNVGALREYAERLVDLSRMQPRTDLAATKFCLTDPGKEYVIFSPEAMAFDVHGLVPDATYHFEWFLTRTHKAAGSGSLRADDPRRQFQPPEREVVLLLKKSE